MALPLRFESIGAGIIPRDVVAALVQDRAGFLWIATGDGLVRYDGHFFRPQERESADLATRNLGWIRAMLAARDGRLWIGTESQGLAVLDPTDGRITLPMAMGAASQAPMIQSLAEDPSGAIWVGSMGDGLVRFDPASGRHTSYRHSGLAGSLPDDRVEALLVDRAGVLWVGSWQGLSRRLPGSDVFEQVGPPGEAGLDGRTVTSLLQAKDGRIWVGTQQGEVAVFDPATGLVQRLSQAGGAVSSLLQAPDGPIWVGRDTGIDLFDAQGGQLLRRLVHDPARPEGLAGNQVHSLLLDRDGWIWIGGMGLGLQRHNPAHQSIWVHEMPPAPGEAARDSDVRSLLQLDSGEIWAATARGGVLVMDTQLRAIGTVPEADRSAAARPVPVVVSAMEQQADGSVWLGTPSAIHQVSRERKPMRSLRHGAGNTNFLHTGSEGQLWVGTRLPTQRLRDPGRPGAAATAAPALRVVQLEDGQGQHRLPRRVRGPLLQRAAPVGWPGGGVARYGHAAHSGPATHPPLGTRRGRGSQRAEHRTACPIWGPLPTYGASSGCLGAARGVDRGRRRACCATA